MNMNEQTEAFDKGYEAWHEQLSIDDNPFPEDSNEEFEWEKGYRTAEFDCDH